MPVAPPSDNNDSRDPIVSVNSVKHELPDEQRKPRLYGVISGVPLKGTGEQDRNDLGD
jgi:hypothetical protein